MKNNIDASTRKQTLADSDLISIYDYMYKSLSSSCDFSILYTSFDLNKAKV